jgi:hypothetical protein
VNSVIFIPQPLSSFYLCAARWGPTTISWLAPPIRARDQTSQRLGLWPLNARWGQSNTYHSHTMDIVSDSILALLILNRLSLYIFITLESIYNYLLFLLYSGEVFNFLIFEKKFTLLSFSSNISLKGTRFTTTYLFLNK